MQGVIFTSVSESICNFMLSFISVLLEHKIAVSLPSFKG